MVLYFENTDGKIRPIAKIDGRMKKEKILDEVFNQINAFLKEHGYKSHYMRAWNTAIKDKWATKFDVGSHTEFFYTVPPCILHIVPLPSLDISQDICHNAGNDNTGDNNNE